MKINGNEIKPGNVIEHNKSLWVAVKTNAVKPGKGGAFNQVELKNLIDGSKLNERFRSADKASASEIGFFSLDNLPLGTTKSTRIRLAELYHDQKKSTEW